VRRAPLRPAGPAARADATLAIDPDPAQLALVRALAARSAERFGLDPSGCFRVKLAASEAAANAIEHGGPAEDGKIHVRAHHTACALILSVRDGGRFATPAPTPGPLGERGRGIPLMRSLLDRLEISTVAGGTIVTLTKYR
jgi:serine/threonine-protein kinase RsbW